MLRSVTSKIWPKSLIEVRLTVAPLTYGAGIKGKVIESLGAGLPCVCTPVAAEGLDLPEALQACVAESAEDLAELICNLHENEEVNLACGHAGLDYVGATFSNEKLDAAMLRVLGLGAPLDPILNICVQTSGVAPAQSRDVGQSLRPGSGTMPSKCAGHAPSVRQGNGYGFNAKRAAPTRRTVSVARSEGVERQE